MIITGPATEAEAVLAFLQAEIDSPRHHFRASLPAAIAAYIDTPVLGDAAQDAERLSILQQVRGFGANKLLFQGWPPSVTWYHQQFTLAEVAQLLYAKHPTWQNLTTGSRRVADGVAGLVLRSPSSDACSRHRSETGRGGDVSSAVDGERWIADGNLRGPQPRYQLRALGATAVGRGDHGGVASHVSVGLLLSLRGPLRASRQALPAPSRVGLSRREALKERRRRALRGEQRSMGPEASEERNALGKPGRR